MAQPGTTAEWQALMGAQPIYGDGLISVRLDPRRVALLTGDGVPRDGGPWAHTTVTVVTDSTGHVVTGHADAPSPYQIVPDDADGPGYHWFGPAFVHGGALFSLAPHNVVDPTSWLGFAAVGTDWVSLDVRAEPALSDVEPTPTTIYDLVTWSAGVYLDVGTRCLYVFGVSRDPADGWTGHDVYVARIRDGRITDPNSWYYLSNGFWSPDPGQATPILRAVEHGGTETAFPVWRDALGWHVAGRRGGMWGAPELTMWTAASLTRPLWFERKLADLPTDAYLPWVHHEFDALTDGTYPATYNQPGRESTWIGVHLT